MEHSWFAQQKVDVVELFMLLSKKIKLIYRLGFNKFLFTFVSKSDSYEETDH